MAFSFVGVLFGKKLPPRSRFAFGDQRNFLKKVSLDSSKTFIAWVQG